MVYYRLQSKKENPFDGLSDIDAMKLKVYFNMFAVPRMSDDEIFDRYGVVLPVDFITALGLAQEVARELQIQG